MLARWSLGREDVAAAIEAAVARTLDDGFRTADLAASDTDAGSKVGTREMTEAIVERIGIAITRAARETVAAQA